ncbi:MAG: glycosyltransferase family 87 protein [Candidatus Limnocylindrales bacterium]
MGLPPATTPRTRFSHDDPPAQPYMAVGLLLVVVLSFGLWSLGRGWAQIDYFQFWAVGRLAQSGVTDIYSEPARQELAARIDTDVNAGSSVRAVQAAASWPVLQTYGTPFLFALFGVLSTGDYDLDSGLWQLLSLGALIAAVLALCACFRYSRPAGLFLLALILAASGPLASDIRTGNVNQLQVGILAAILVTRARWSVPRGDLASGVLLGLLVGFKPDAAPVVGALVVLWLLDRRFATCATAFLGMCLGGVAALVVGALVWGSIQPWFDWIGALGELAGRAQYTVARGNYSLARVALEATGVNLVIPLGAALTVATTAAIWRSSLRPISAGVAIDDRGESTNGESRLRLQFERECLVLGAAIAILLLASPLAWLHYFTLLVPLQLFLLRPGDVSEAPVRVRSRQLLVGGSILLLAFGPIDTLVGSSPQVAAVQAIAAAAILLAVAIAELVLPDQRREWTGAD